MHWLARLAYLSGFLFCALPRAVRCSALVVSEWCQEPALELGALYEGEAKAWAIRGA